MTSTVVEIGMIRDWNLVGVVIRAASYVETNKLASFEKLLLQLKYESLRFKAYSNVY